MTRVFCRSFEKIASEKGNRIFRWRVAQDNPSRVYHRFVGRLLKLASSLQHNCPFLHRGVEGLLIKAGQLASDERVDRSVARSLGERGFT
jgi:hypothetical protein